MADHCDLKMCSSCFKSTKYECISCSEPFCNNCTTFESNEDTNGWKMGRRVGYCDPCLERSQSNKQVVGEGKDNDEDDDDDDDDEEKYNETELSLDDRKSPATKKKSGRKSQWSEEAVNDLVDVIINNENYKQKLIFINTKNQKNTELYKSVLNEVKSRAVERNEEIGFNVQQVRNKFKRCVSACKTAALTIKTATGIARFQSDKGYGRWFENLFPLVKSRESCQPEMAIEPSTSSSCTDVKENSLKEFVPVKSSRRKRKREADTTEELLNTVKEAISKDPMKDILNFMREEMEKSREHEKELVRMMMQQPESQGYREYERYSPNNFQGHASNMHTDMHTFFNSNIPSSQQNNFAGFQQSQGSLTNYQPF